MEIVRDGGGYAAVGRSFAYGLDESTTPVGAVRIAPTENGIQFGVRCIRLRR